jgi:nicotinate dehydrogenase subunit B
MATATLIDRRGFLKRSGALLFAVPAAGALSIFPLAAARAQHGYADSRAIAPAELDSWITVETNGAVTAYFGKMDMGQGVDTAVAQFVADELDVAIERVAVVMGDTHRTPNQGGASGSTGCRQGAIALRDAAAEARRVFLSRASELLGAAVEDLRVEDGRVFVTADPARSVEYGEIIADGFRQALDWNERYGNALVVTGSARPKDPSTYRVVGTSVPRKDIPGKILATTEYCHHVQLPEMLHGRVLRPPVANSVPLSFDADSIADIPGSRVVHRGDFLAVVAEDEWRAVKAARALVVTWSTTEAPFPDGAALYEHIRGAPVAADNSVANFGPRQDYDTAPSLAAIASASRQVEAEYELPFHSHARMGPSIGVADVRDGEALVFSDTQKPHDTRDGIAKLLGLPAERVRVIWKPGSGSYGRSDADEAAFEAAVLSQALGRPVRVQWSRAEGHAWDPKAPAAVVRCRAGLDARGAIAGWYFHARGFSGWDVLFNASEPNDTLVGQLLGWPKQDQHNYGVPGGSYRFPNAVHFWETVPPLLERASPLRTAHMRAPQGPHLQFALDSFIDEVAAAGGHDPIALRLAHLGDEREIAVLRAVAEASSWQPRPSPGNLAAGRLLQGRGVSLYSGYGGYAATVCEVEVDRVTGRIWPRRVFVAHECGLIINPLGLRTTIEGNVVQGISRALFEEVRFDRERVLSVDWASYPILEVADAPEVIQMTLIDRPELPPGGAGEPTHVTIAGAIGNAVFDATGVRFRRLPLNPATVRSALA